MNSVVNKLVVLFVFIATTSVCAYAQGTKEIVTISAEALQKGDADLLAANFFQTIEMEILGEENFYSKKQATLLIKNFFSGNQPTSFVVVHEGVKDANAFAIGTLKTGSGIFRVSIFIKSDGGKSYIHQLRIEKNS